MRAGKRRLLHAPAEARLLKLIEMAKANIKAKWEHPFLLVKQQFRFQKTRLRGMAKTCCKVHVLAALTNLSWLAICYWSRFDKGIGVSIWPDQGQIGEKKARNQTNFSWIIGQSGAKSSGGTVAGLLGFLGGCWPGLP